MFKQKEAWKEAAWIFAMSRLMIILISIFCVGFFSQAARNFGADCKIDAFCIYYHWDVVHYVHIAFYGYRVVQDTGFFPLWPLILHGVGWLLGGNNPISYIIAGLLVANICFYFALVFLYRLVSEEFEQSTARRALYYFAFSPFAFFFFLGYTESLFVMLCIATFLLLRYESRWAWLCAGLLGFLATMTRSSGLALAVPFLVIGLRDGLRLHFERASFPRWWSLLLRLAPVLLIPVALGIYMLYLWSTKGDPLAFSSQEAAVWNRHLSLPWQGIVASLQLMFDPRSNVWTRTQNLLDTLFTILPLAILFIGWRRIPLHYILFCLALALIALSFPIYYIEPLTSLPRYLLVAFPVTILCAMWGKHARFDAFYTAFSLPLFGLITIMFLVAFWVA